jgi:hypothetical protein
VSQKHIKMVDALPPDGVTVAASANGDPSNATHEGAASSSSVDASVPRMLYASALGRVSLDDPGSAITDTLTEPNSQGTTCTSNRDSVEGHREDGESNDCNDTDNVRSPETQPPVTGVLSPQLRRIPNPMLIEDKFELGYDSDGEGPPDPVDEADYEEAVLAERGEDGVILNGAEEETSEIPDETEDTTPRHIDIEEEALTKMTVKRLKFELGIREVQFTATLKKPELVERLRLALTNKVKVSIFGTTPDDPVAKKKKKGVKATSNDMTGFAPGAYWDVLKPLPDVVQEPTNTIPNARAPTVPLEEAGRVPKKHNFAESFDRPIFTGKKQAQKVHANGKKAFDEQGDPVWETVQRQTITARKDFLSRHKLTRFSDPVEFANAFIPWETNAYDKDLLSMSMLTTFTNTKAALANAGPGGVCYRTFKPFTVKELRQHIGLYVWNGIRPAPRMEYHLTTQQQDPIHGSDYIMQHMGGTAAALRHKHFKAFFACQDPRKPPPNRKQVPLHKVSTVIKWINYIGKQSVRLGMNASVDEQTIGFQGKHQDKLRVTYKREGDGFQADTLCERGFTYGVYFRNEQPAVKYTRQGYSPLHARVLWLFDLLTDNHHRIWMDNLYLSAKFVKACYNHDRKVLIAGVTRKSGRGIPLSVLQEEVKNKAQQEAIRGTVKVAVLKGDPDCPKLVAASVYDTKPVHFLSMICDCIKWVEKQRPTFNTATKRTEQLNFLRLNINDDYNNSMGHVDVSDQLRNYYRFDHWLRQWKWWWSIWNWGLGVLLVNAYVTYLLVMEENDIPKNQCMSHYMFRRAIALAWIKSDEPAIRERQKQKEERKSSLQSSQSTSVSGKRSATSDTNATTNSKRRKKDEDRRTTRSAAVEDATKKPRAPTLNDASLADQGGSFGQRLNRMVGHYCEAIERGARCALHRWCSGIEVKSHVYSCSQCKVHLCIECFQVFHTVYDLVGQKASLGNQYKDKKAQQDGKSDSAKASKK